MPSISMFYGIIIKMLFKDIQQHNSPHIHAVYGDYEAVFDVNTCKLLAGKFPPKQTKLVEAWMELYQDDLKANWKLAVIGEQPYKIKPL